MGDERGDVVKGPDLFGPHPHRPYVRLSDDTHSFHGEESLYATVTTTRRPAAIRLSEGDFVTGSLPRESYVNPWTIATINHPDVAAIEGRLGAEVTDTIATAAAAYMGLEIS